MALKNNADPGWKPDGVIEKWAREQGYGRGYALTEEGLRELRAAHDGSVAGLYLIESTNHDIYVGISTSDVTRRLRTHAETWPDMQGFRFIPSSASASEIRSMECRLVHDAERHGLVNRNTEWASSIVGASSLDELVPIDDQQSWLAAPRATANACDCGELTEFSASAVARNRHKYDALLRLPHSDSILDAFAAYLRYCVPFPRTTEATFWTATSLPAWSQGRRILTCTMAVIEVFYIFETTSGEDPHAMLFVDRRHLPGRGLARLGFRRELRQFGARQVMDCHPSGGNWEQGIRFDNLGLFVAALESIPELQFAAAHFALDRMRRPGSGYAQSHNRSLAEAALLRAFAPTP
ncbi:hypothetical protein [Antrihabitans cavernicola]|uniref:GIY-YIG nuclease family protein n=1 Tax=Antrihabitans cavernicola TaxID=2495913 RepID=A0A5A7SKN6_9NOCA|nr:hypothetical protein [Spelaeibacter cavernicola]KAA0024781.1 hypothetical protein FOY51_02275 [Spelaeibacter cavernicola]